MTQPMMVGQPMGGQPMMGQPMMGQPMMGQPMMGQPMMGQPMVGQPMMGQPMVGQPMMGQPMVGQPMMGQPMVGQPMMVGQQINPLTGQPMIVQPQVMIQPGYVQFHGKDMAICSNVIQNLSDSRYATIIQEVELFEMVSGCETPNRYNVFVCDTQGIERYLFKCKEESSWCQRNCCTSQSRSFCMKLKHVMSNSLQTDDFSITFAQFKRPFKCTCCCLGRPEMKGEYTQEGNSFGKVVDQCTLCDPLLNVYDRNGEVKYKIQGSCCQCGFMCRKNFFGKLSEANFSIYRADDMNTEVGKIVRKVTGFINLISDADTFTLTFPNDATPEDKLTLIGAVLMMDYQYYENDANEEKNKREKKDPLLH